MLSDTTSAMVDAVHAREVREMGDAGEVCGPSAEHRVEF